MILSSGENKESLSHFIAREWSSAKYCTKVHGLTLFVSHGHECHRISTASGHVVSECVPEPDVPKRKQILKSFCMQSMLAIVAIKA